MQPRLQLVCPSEHDLYFNLDGDGYAEPITGHVIIQGYENIVDASAQLQLCLIRTVASEKNYTAVSARENQFLKKIRRPFLNAPRPAEDLTIESCAIINETTCRVAQVHQTAAFGKLVQSMFHFPLLSR